MSLTKYIDLPDGFRLDLPCTYANRIDGVCLDLHHCTIANAIHEVGQRLGIRGLSRRGVSRTMVGVYLDPAVYPWADPNTEYRGRLTKASAEVAVELDDWHDRPEQHRRHKKTLKQAALKMRDGLREVWAVITITAPLPSQRKGYRSSLSGTGTHPPKPHVTGLPNRKYNGSTAD